MGYSEVPLKLYNMIEAYRDHDPEIVVAVLSHYETEFKCRIEKMAELKEENNDFDEMIKGIVANEERLRNCAVHIMGINKYEKLVERLDYLEHWDEKHRRKYLKLKEKHDKMVWQRTYLTYGQRQELLNENASLKMEVEKQQERIELQISLAEKQAELHAQKVADAEAKHEGEWKKGYDQGTGDQTIHLQALVSEAY